MEAQKQPSSATPDCARLLKPKSSQILPYSGLAELGYFWASKTWPYSGLADLDCFWAQLIDAQSNQDL